MCIRDRYDAYWCVTRFHSCVHYGKSSARHAGGRCCGCGRYSLNVIDAYFAVAVDIAAEELLHVKCGMLGVIEVVDILGVVDVDMARAVAVSYTHLDVYKRQLLMGSCGLTALLRLGAASADDAEKARQLAQLLYCVQKPWLNAD